MPTCPRSPSLRRLWFSSHALCQARGDAGGDQRCLKELSAFQGSQIRGLVLSAVGKGLGGSGDSGCPWEGSGVAGCRGERDSLFTVCSSLLSEVLSCAYIELLMLFL